LHRFLQDIEDLCRHKICVDSDGRSPEQLFYDNRALANNRMPFCSRILKAERLQNFYRDGDTLLFGIGCDEAHRAHRLLGVYQIIAAKTGKMCKVSFPLIEEKVTKIDVDRVLKQQGLVEPLLYRLGFTHNNCSGGCVRAGKKHWKLLYEKLPDVYLDRERVEKEVANYLGKEVTFFKDESLSSFRSRIERGELSDYYTREEVDQLTLPFEQECIGICHTLS